ncbi:hypothetical protein J7M22_00635 [Candidatus Poribacteria bacterium]|nr:hypothetical protein [Candidatus Poribacteria bacterium]
MYVTRLDSIILTEDDLPNLKLTQAVPIRGAWKEPPCLAGFHQYWDGNKEEEHIGVRYWLFDTIRNAQKAADKWRFAIAQGAVIIDGKPDSIYQPETDPNAIIGDKTWRAYDCIWFVKANVLVHVSGQSLIDQLSFTRMVARKIEAKISAELNKP